jgi:hypothetical protein
MFASILFMPILLQTVMAATINIPALGNFLRCLRTCDQSYKFAQIPGPQLLIAPSSPRDIDLDGVDRCLSNCWDRYYLHLNIMVTDSLPGTDRHMSEEAWTDIEGIEARFGDDYTVPEVEDEDEEEWSSGSTAEGRPYNYLALEGAHGAERSWIHPMGIGRNGTDPTNTWVDSLNLCRR